MDMWVHDPSWIGLKLKKLLNYSEAELDFMHWVPGNGKQMHYPSTISYIAYLVLYRYKVLGLLDSDGMAIRGGLINRVNSESRTSHIAPILKGKPCPECGAHSYAKVDGCDRCGSCGFTGSCG
jgi:ribonucleoside-diphosphate reductase alpha chain